MKVCFLLDIYLQKLIGVNAIRLKCIGHLIGGINEKY